MRKIVFGILILNLLLAPAYGYDFDVSVDDHIKKKYDTSKLEQDVLNNKVHPVQNNSKSNNVTKSVPDANLDYAPAPLVITKADRTYSKKISGGTLFNVKSNKGLTGYTTKGSVVSFTSVDNVYKKNVTIPAGTKFTGVVTNSHPAQRTGNGALISIKLTSMTYNGENYKINGKITKVKPKKVFFNKIKGERKYLTGVENQIDKGKKFYNKTRNVSSKMADNPVLVILSPLPSVAGLAGYAGCTILSPVTALTTRGGNLSIPSGSTFEIKLTDKVYVK